MLTRHAIALPALLAAASLALAADGGSVPLDQPPSLQLSVSDATPGYGERVRVTGNGAQAARGRVTVWFSAPGHARASLASVRPDRQGRWSTLIRTVRSGTVTASQGGSVFEASPPGGTKVLIHPAAVLPSSIALSKGGTARLRLTIRPGGRWAWNARLRRGATVIAGAAGITGSDGLVRAVLKARKHDVVELIISGRSGYSRLRLGATVAKLRPAVASWYGLYGSGVACGGVLGRNQIGVAHKTLPCGAKVTVSYHGRTIVAPVIDRGPYVSGREFDLTGAAARALHFDGVGTVWVSP